MLEIQHISKQYGTVNVLENISISVAKGEVVSILGRSGCGKTTLLKIIAGLLDHGEGKIEMDGTDLSTIPANKRAIVYLYQEPLLFPHLDVFGNIAFGLTLRKESKIEIKNKVEHIAAELELSGHLKKMPEQLSGGQRQRVSFGRALILNPKVLLLDEPFGNLDAQTRTSMQALFKNVAIEHQITAIFVTHDLKEALIVGNKYGIMQKGSLDIYYTKDAFIKVPDTGMKAELEFWQSMLQLNK